MSGGIAQLVAIGAQDAHIVGDPQVSFFRSNYKRHTNFAQSVERQVIQGNPGPNAMSTVRFERKGDLLSYVYLTKTNSAAESVAISSTDISKVELLIGGQIIDDQDSTVSENILKTLCSTTECKAFGTQNLMYPLRFSFCEHWTSALPLVALQYHDVEIRITWASGASATDRYECWANFISLDTMEREELANKPQNMLIYQVQKATASNNKIQELNFNHPIKFLAASGDIVGDVDKDKIHLQINGVDIGEPRIYDVHYRQAATFYHVEYDGTFDSSNFLYPFCLNTNKLQPTGTLNFSRLDSARLVTDASAGFAQDVYAVNYNVLRIQNGMGGLMYSN
jgi:hypothetical protein